MYLLKEMEELQENIRYPPSPTELQTLQSSQKTHDSTPDEKDRGRFDDGVPQKNFVMQARVVFLDLEDRLFLLDVTRKGKQSFAVIVVYVNTSEERFDFFKNL